jgi:hypothetical protein
VKRSANMLKDLFPHNQTPAILLVHPLGHTWLDVTGHEMAQAPSPSCPVVIVADLIEETHVQIGVPAVTGKDRQSFVQIQMQSLLPDTPFRAVWQTPSSWPFLSKPFSLNGLGVPSLSLKETIAQQLLLERPVVGVWSLSYLISIWMVSQKDTAGQPCVLLALAQSYGLRLVLLKEDIPVFSRLLFDSTTYVQELTDTIKYLQDNRILDRGLQPVLAVLNPPEGFEAELQANGLQLLPRREPIRPFRTLVWPAFVKLAQRQVPGQMANVHERRFYLAQQAKRAVLLSGMLLVVGLLWGAYSQAVDAWTQRQQTQDAERQSVDMHHQALVIQQAITASGVDTGVMRLAIQVQRQELAHGIELLPPFWALGQLLSQQTQTRLNHSSLRLQPQACEAANAVAPVAPNANTSDDTLQVEWSFEIAPHENTSPRERQRLLEETAETIQRWKAWRVKVDPLQQAAVAPISVESVGVSVSLPEWKWCLSPATKGDTLNALDTTEISR